MKTPKELYYKAIKLKKRLTPEEEQIISTSPVYSYFYAKEVIGGRWKEAEVVIIQDSLYSFLYVRDVLKKRWPEAEDIIKNSGYWRAYQHHFKVEFKVEEILNS